MFSFHLQRDLFAQSTEGLAEILEEIAGEIRNSRRMGELPGEPDPEAESDHFIDNHWRIHDSEWKLPDGPIDKTSEAWKAAKAGRFLKLRFGDEESNRYLDRQKGKRK